MSQPKTLAGKLAEVMGTVKHIPKLGRNEAQRYDFVRDADVLDKVRDALAERNVAVMVDVNDCQHTEYQTARQRQEGGVSWMTTVAGAISFLDGDSDAVVTTGFRGVGSDTGDKGYYKAVTGGVKYALLKTFLIPTGDDPEADAQPPRSRAPRPAQTAQDGLERPAQAQPPQDTTRSAPPPQGEQGGMTVGQALEALKVAGIPTKAASDKGRELYGEWSLKAMTGDQRAHVVEELTGVASVVTTSAGEGASRVPAASSPAPDDELWAGIPTVPAA